MKDDNQVVTFAIDPGANGGYALCFGGLRAITLHNLDTFSDLLEHVTELEGIHKGFLRAIIEDVPPYAGKNILSFTTFKLGKNCGQLEGLFLSQVHTCGICQPQEVAIKIHRLERLTRSTPQEST